MSLFIFREVLTRPIGAGEPSPLIYARHLEKTEMNQDEWSSIVERARRRKPKTDLRESLIKVLTEEEDFQVLSEEDFRIFEQSQGVEPPLIFYYLRVTGQGSKLTC